jgi:hypothetical protein
MEAKLSELESALAKGSGRAMALLRAIDPERADSALLHACEHNLTYDGQCENERSAYLSRLIEATGQQDRFFERLIADLQQALSDETELHSVQVFRILARLAASQIDRDGPVVRRLFDQLPREDRLDVMKAFVRLDGLPALIACAIDLSTDMEEEGWRSAELVDVLRERDGASIDNDLALFATDDLRLKQFLSAAKSARPDSQPLPDTYDFPKIRQSLMAGVSVSAGGVRRYSDAEWVELSADFSAHDDVGRVLPYLRLFGRRRFEGDASALLKWADNEDPKVAYAATYALRRLADARVRARALERLAAGQVDGVRLLLSNYRAEDLPLVETQLKRPATDKVMHSLAADVLDLVEENAIPPADSLPAHLLIYEKTPCSLCRYYAVRRLGEANQIPDWMAEECRFDAEPDTVSLVAT